MILSRGLRRAVPNVLRCTNRNSLRIWALSQYPKRRLSVRSRKVSKPRDLYLELSDRSEIWQALRQQCCRCACQISKRYDNLKYQSRGFETLRDLTKRRLFGYWDGALNAQCDYGCRISIHLYRSCVKVGNDYFGSLRKLWLTSHKQIHI